MKTYWLRMAVVVLTACLIGSAALARDEGAKKERGDRRNKGQKQGRQMKPEQIVRGFVSSVLIAAAELPEGKTAVEMYQAETEQIEKELRQILVKYHREVIEGGDGVDTEALAKKATEEMIPVTKRLVESRAKLAESLAAVAKANPDVVAEKVAEQTAERLKKMRGRAKEMRERIKARREKHAQKNEDAGGEVIE